MTTITVALRTVLLLLLTIISAREGDAFFLVQSPIVALSSKSWRPNTRVTTMVPPGAAASDDSSGSSSSSNIFTSEGWKAIQDDLDRVPVFTVATPQGNPLAYQVQLNEKSFTVPFFYCDVADALAELDNAKQQQANNQTTTTTKTATDPGLDILPFPLGQAFQLWCKDESVLVPSKKAILQAGAPPGTNPVGQQVPMFACMEIMEENPQDGTGRLPLFMSLEDANAAVKEAVDQANQEEPQQQQDKKATTTTDDFDVVCLSLSSAIEQLATIPETPGFHFIPPSTSMKYIQDYLS